MTRLKKELKKRGIISQSDPNNAYGGIETDESLAFITKDFIITVYDCNVLDLMFRIYSTSNYELIGEQNVYKANHGFNNPWDSGVFFLDDED